MYTVLPFTSTWDGIVIVVEKLSKRFGSVQVLDGLDCTVPQNQVVGFLGVNGAGKTTTMRILSTALQPTSGTVVIGGYNVQEQPEAVRGMMGYLPEKPPLYPQLSIGQYLAFLADFRQLSNPQTCIGNALEKVGLLGKERMAISKLSKGYQQRVGLAQALLHSPQYLILDEPASGLDPSQMVEIRQVLTALAEETSILLSTHLLSEAERMCTHHIILHEGRVSLSGTLSELRQYDGGGGLVLKLLTAEWTVELLKQTAALEYVEKVALMPSTDVRLTVIHVSLDKGVTEKFLQWCLEQKVLQVGEPFLSNRINHFFWSIQPASST